MEAEKAAERLMARRRAASVEVEPVLPRPFTYTQAYQSGGSYSAFDYKVKIIRAEKFRLKHHPLAHLGQTDAVSKIEEG